MMKREQSPVTRASAVVILLTLAASTSALAAEPSQMKTTPSQAQAASAPPEEGAPIRPGISSNDEAGTLPERIDVQSMKRRYWTVGNEDLMDVVQNRRYTKKGRLETALKYGFWSDDPFQTQKSIGLSVGYHLNEYFSLHGFYASVSASNNQAYTAAGDATASQGLRINPDVNPASSVMGAEARASLIYGKLSFLGNKIIYYDLNVAGGLSQHAARVGSSIGYFAGLGQQFFINKNLFVSLDYRLMLHTDKFPSTQNPALDRSRSVTTNWIQIGVGAFLF